MKILVKLNILRGYYSTDLSVLMCWYILVKDVRRLYHIPSSLQELEIILAEKCREILSVTIETQYEFIPSRIKVVITAKGYPAIY